MEVIIQNFILIVHTDLGYKGFAKFIKNVIIFP